MVSSQDLLNYLDTHGTTSESALANHFKTSVEVIAMMCERLVEKGRVKLVTTGGCAGGCGCTCGSGEKTVRHWQRVAK